MNMFRKHCPNFDGTNYDSWKEKMKTCLLCMGSAYWILTKLAKTIIEEKDLETCTKAERDLFMCDMRAREALFTILLEIEYNQVKSLATSKLI